jgi:hypothetical protein
VLTLGMLSIAAPWALLGLVALPLIWWLLRLRPPVPTRIVFPPLALLRRLVGSRESPARIPPWLLFLRLMMAAVLVAAVAQLLLNAEARLSGKGPLYLIIDDDWAAANHWPPRRAALKSFIDHAARRSRPVVMVRTAPPPEGAAQDPIALISAADARSMIEGLVPRPWPVERSKTVQRLLTWAAKAAHRPGDVIWLSNGLETKNQNQQDSVAALTRRLRRLGVVRVMVDPVGQLPVVLRPPKNSGKALSLIAERPQSPQGSMPKRGLAIRALDEGGQILARVPLVFEGDGIRAEAKLDLPAELRNRLTRLEVAGMETAGAVVLVDERWRRRPVGLVRQRGAEIDQPLLDAHHYLRQALTPFTEVRRGDVSELLQRPLAVLIMADADHPDPDQQLALKVWLDNGGILVRFAGPNLARDAAADDTLLPVRLRRGNRAIGGALSWRQPESLAPFPEASPFYGLSTPKDVRVRRQVLAEPSLDLAGKTWARLRDRTPLVTAEKRGQGWLVLMHTTADGTWADLSFSGIFVHMLRRLVDLSQGVSGSSGGPMAPLSSLNAFGQLGAPPGGATAINAAELGTALAGPGHPPGFYGDTRLRRALNLGAGLGEMSALGKLPPGIARQAYAKTGTLDLQPWLFALALVLFMIDLYFSLHMRGVLRLAPAAAIFLLLMLPGSATAQDPEAFALANALKIRLAYVLSGDAETDEISRAGLIGLTTMLSRRTAAELAPPQGVDPAVDELAFFPLLYWPVLPSAVALGAGGERVRTYLRNGGTILFDTRDQGADGGGGFRRLAWQLSLPPLVPVDANHVLTRAFYLLREFPGRWAGGGLWVEKAGERVNDGVSPVVAGNHDWAAAWAMDDAQRPMFAVVPGGERQREMAYRFGINLVMYTLTGNYKADQVHMPAIIRRLGQ